MPEIWEMVMAGDVLDIQMEILVDTGHGEYSGDNGVYWAEDVNRNGVSSGLYDSKRSACMAQTPYNACFGGSFEYVRMDGRIGSPLTGWDDACDSLVAANRVVMIRPIQGQLFSHGYTITENDVYNKNSTWVINIPKIRVDPTRVSGGEKVWVRVCLTLDCQGICSDGAVCCQEIYIGALCCGNPFLSDELTTVQKVYIAYYLRPADPAGLLWWAQQLYNAGGNMSAIIDAFANSEESHRLWGNIHSGNIGAVIDEVYWGLFHRVPDAGGKQFYVNGFNSGRFTPGTIVLNILDGATGQDAAAVVNKLDYSRKFVSVLDPDGDYGPPYEATYDMEDEEAARMLLDNVRTDDDGITESEVKGDIIQYIADFGDPILLPW
jgi:hypothetical protein